MLDRRDAPLDDLGDATELVELPDLARQAGVGRVVVKLEGQRPLGNFKVHGGLVAGLRALARVSGAPGRSPRLICASDGNHGLAVAAGARRAGASASIYLPVGVTPVRARRIEAIGGTVVWIAGTYDDAVTEAAAAAARGEGLLIPDTTSDPADPVVHDVMAGYARITRELAAQLGDVRLSHSFVQAGVGGLAAAIADGMPDVPVIVVEPEAAACVGPALIAGHPVRISGELHTAAEMLSCGLASAPAIAILLRRGARSIVVDEVALHAAVATLRAAGGPDTTPSGAAGLAGLLQVAGDPALRATVGLERESQVLLIATEGPVVDG